MSDPQAGMSRTWYIHRGLKSATLVLFFMIESSSPFLAYCRVFTCAMHTSRDDDMLKGVSSDASMMKKNARVHVLASVAIFDSNDDKLFKLNNRTGNLYDDCFFFTF